MKRTPYKKLKDKTWKLCSLYIRLKDANENGRVRCYTCPPRRRARLYTKMQAGHFIPGRTNGILFDERGMRPQCPACNIFGGGKPIEFMIALEKELGQKEAIKLRDELIKQKNTVTPLSMLDLAEWIRYFEGKLEELGYEE